MNPQHNNPTKLALSDSVDTRSKLLISNVIVMYIQHTSTTEAAEKGQCPRREVSIGFLVEHDWLPCQTHSCRCLGMQLRLRLEDCFGSGKSGKVYRGYFGRQEVHFWWPWWSNPKRSKDKYGPIVKIIFWKDLLVEIEKVFKVLFQ